MTIQAVRGQIRFQLEQLKAHNKHHGFEDIAREFTRQRICRNLLPATGPVSAGGDQGIDYETYTTYLDDDLNVEGTNLFEGVAKNGNIFFACSTQSNIAQKIKSDINTIFVHTQERRPVTYFCVESLPVSKRHGLIKWCREEYDVELQIIDGEALSENLSDPDIFWIAEQYLNIPSEIYPKPVNDDEWYSEYRARWIEHDSKPYNYSDFYEIKYGLRKATFNEKLKSEIPGWIKSIKKFLESGIGQLRSKAQYEICVAALRGQNNLTSYKDTVIDYFEKIESIENPNDLTDAGILLMYCSAAKKLGQFDIDEFYLHEISNKYISRIEYFLETISGINTRCTLLENKARAYLLPYLDGEEPSRNLDKAFQYWCKVVDLVEEAALFPLDSFSDSLGALTPFIGSDPRFLEITDKVDQLLVNRVGGFAAAEKCRDRAVAFYDNGKILLAIEHLHRAKINWFSAEALRGTIIVLRFIARAYSELGLMYAAKYYALSAFYLAYHSNDEDVRDHISNSIFQLAEIMYESGEWLTFMSVMELALLTHHHYDQYPLDILEHDNLKRTLFYSTIVRTLSQRFWPDISHHVERKFSEWALDDITRTELTKLIDGQDENTYWQKTPLEDIWLQIEDNLSGRPFNDIGEKRTISWKALGITWEVVFSNDYELTRVVEEFVAVLQVALADFAMDDLQLIPVQVRVNALLAEDNILKETDKFDNKRLEWDIKIPSYKDSTPKNIDDRRMEILAFAITVLGYCTTLKKGDYENIIDAAFKKGLGSKVFLVRPYPELYREAISTDMFMKEEKSKLSNVEHGRIFNFKENPELTWNNEEGIFYEQNKAILHVRNRYSRLSNLMKIIWPKIVASEKHRQYFEELRKKGYKDWHIMLIACNAVANHIANKIDWTGKADEQYMEEIQKLTLEIIDGKLNSQVEQLSISEIDLEDFKIQEDMSYISILRTWGMEIHSPVPNIEAVRRFMMERYKVFETDEPHNNLF